MDTDTTTRANPNSFNTQVLALLPGETVSRTRPVDPTTPVQRLPMEMPEIRQQLRSACTPAVTRAKKATGSDFSIEVGDLVLPSGALHVVAIVTRLN